ncbi:MAG: (2Fe-2S)-binding protein, partial [Mycobacteriaceae bacterium]|nr:(2Fe-2S)-binding protein [Mycobacteriaceae bacterium]
TLGTGLRAEDRWLPGRRPYTDTRLLAGIIATVQDRIYTRDRRVAISTFFLSFAARLWSIGVGGLAGYQLVPDLAAAQLLFREDDGQIRLHAERPVAWRGDGLPQQLADLVLETHLVPLAAAVQRLASISEKVLQGNTASALLGAAQVFDRYRSDSTPGPGWQLARRLCQDQRLSGAIQFSDNGLSYRRLSCCLYYRTPAGGLCGDCILGQRTRCPS